MAFAAIDFETANYSRTSICAVGVVIVRDKDNQESFYSLVHPTPNYYSPQCVAVHGLTETDTDSAPRFPEVWTQVEQLIGGLPLVAHNRPFDQSCLRAACDHYGMPEPPNEFYCTLQAARRVLKGEIQNFRLPTVAGYLGFDLHRHHHALADAEACAYIASRILELL